MNDSMQPRTLQRAISDALRVYDSVQIAVRAATPFLDEAIRVQEAATNLLRQAGLLQLSQSNEPIAHLSAKHCTVTTHELIEANAELAVTHSGLVDAMYQLACYYLWHYGSEQAVFLLQAIVNFAANSSRATKLLEHILDNEQRSAEKTRIMKNVVTIWDSAHVYKKIEALDGIVREYPLIKPYIERCLVEGMNIAQLISQYTQASQALQKAEWGITIAEAAEEMKPANMTMKDFMYEVYPEIKRQYEQNARDKAIETEQANQRLIHWFAKLQETINSNERIILQVPDWLLSVGTPSAVTMVEGNRHD